MPEVRVTEAVVEQAVAALLRRFLAELGPARQFTLQSSLERDLGLGSLERVELLARVETEIGVRLPDAVAAEADTVGDLVRAVAEAEGHPAEAPSGAAAAGPLGTAAVPETAGNLLEALYAHCAADPERVHLYLRRKDGSEQALTYGAVAGRACQVAAELRERGIGAGDRVAIMLPTGEDFFFSFLGVLLAQAIPVPIYPPFRADRIEDFATRQAGILRNAEVAMLITVGRGETLGQLLRPMAPSLAEVVVAEKLGTAGSAAWPALPRGGEAAALIQYTSGSTGNPKGVLLTHANLLANIRALGAVLEVKPGDVGVTWLPLYHDMGLIGCWLLSLYFGMPLAVLSPLAFLSRPERWLWAIHYHRATLSVGPNFAYDLCARKIPDAALEGLDLRCWRTALNGSEPVRPETLERFAKRFAPYGFRPEAMTPVYGLAESSLAVTAPVVGRGPRIDRIRRERFEAEGVAEPYSGTHTGKGAEMAFVGAGKALAGHQVRIVDQAGQPVGERTQGRIEFRGPSAMSGYFRNPEATAAILHEGWYDSGDLGYWADGDLFVTGRSKEIILKAGRNLYPHEIEAAVAEVEGIRKGCVAAFGAPDAQQGTERLVVVAETRAAGSECGALRGAVNQRLMDLIGVPPDDVVFLPPGTLPKTSSGKLRRTTCRQQYERRELGASQRGLVWQWVRLAARWLPHALGAARRKAVRLAYAGWVYPTFAVYFLICWACLVTLPAGRRGRAVVDRLTRWWMRVIGIKITIEGATNLPEGPLVLAGNHASFLDPLFLMAALSRDAVFVAKREMLKAPMLGTCFRRLEHIMVERGDAAQSVVDTARMEEILRSGEAVFVFPEGTFTRARGLRPFKLGAFMTAARVGCPVVPVALRGPRYVLPEQTWWPRRGPVQIVVGAPIWPEGAEWRDIVRLRDAVFAGILEHCGEPRLEITSAALPAKKQ
jgi:acyl carrier protein